MQNSVLFIAILNVSFITYFLYNPFTLLTLASTTINVNCTLTRSFREIAVIVQPPDGVIKQSVANFTSYSSQFTFVLPIEGFDINLNEKIPIL